jgi:SSS family solute:Na+ symporter
MDVYRPLVADSVSPEHLVVVGRIAAVIALITASVAAQPLLGSFDQGFQFIQEFTGFFTPGICVIFLLGMFWSRCTASAALVAAIASALLSFALRQWWPALPFIDRVGLVFLICMAVAVIVSLLQKPQPPSITIELKNIDYSTSAGFNIAAVVIVAVLIVLYATWW